jgi:hypothetical protein
MGLAFGLSRDKELEQTRLDLERARMEREDFRNGGGPDTSFMHYDDSYRTPQESERIYQYCVRPRVEYQLTARQTLKRVRQDIDILQRDFYFALDALKAIADAGNADAARAFAALGPDDVFEEFF